MQKNRNTADVVNHFKLNDLVTFKRTFIETPINQNTDDTQEYVLFSKYIGVVIDVKKSQSKLESQDLDCVTVFWLVSCKDTDDDSRLNYVATKDGALVSIKQFQKTIHYANALSYLHVEEEARKKSMRATDFWYDVT